MFGLSWSQLMVLVRRGPTIISMVKAYAPFLKQAWPHIWALIVIARGAPSIDPLRAEIEAAASEMGFALASADAAVAPAPPAVPAPSSPAPSDPPVTIAQVAAKIHTGDITDEEREAFARADGTATGMSG